MTDFIEAAEFFDFLQLQQLIEKGVDVNQINDFGDSALHVVITRQKYVNLLLTKGKVNPNIQNNIGSTPLHKAAYIGNPKIITALLAANADPNIKNHAGFYPEQYLSPNKIDIYNQIVGNTGEVIRIPRDQHHKIVGKGGAAINKIRETSSTIVNIPPKDENSNDIKIYGRPENIKKAKQLIYEIVPLNRVMNDQNDIVHQEAEIKCPVPRHKHVLIKPAKLKKDFGVQAVIPPPEDPKNNVIRIIGEPDKIQAAVKYIHEITKDQDNNSNKKRQPKKNDGQKKPLTVANALPIRN